MSDSCTEHSRRGWKSAVLASVFSIAGLADADESEALQLAGLSAYSPPSFPVELKGTNIGDGYVLVAFTVGADGRIDDAVVMESTHPAFSDAVMKVLPAWTLAPEPRDTIPRREVVQFDFHRNGIVNTVSHMDAAKSAFTASPTVEVETRTVPWTRLEQQPRRLTAVSPAVPKSLAQQFTNEQVAVNFVIDAAGQVRVAAVPAATDPQVAAAVLKAMKEWQFSVPMYRGRPVAVEATHVFGFGPVTARN